METQYMWLCTKCERKHGTKSNALNCCPNIKEMTHSVNILNRLKTLSSHLCVFDTVTYNIADGKCKNEINHFRFKKEFGTELGTTRICVEVPFFIERLVQEPITENMLAMSIFEEALRCKERICKENNI